jgi:hypothetical protein
VAAGSDVGIGVVAISVEQDPVLPGVEAHAAYHGCEYRVKGRGRSTQLYRPRLLSPLRGLIYSRQPSGSLDD